MKIGIQPTPIGFTKTWIEYCNDNNIDYKLVDCYSNDIIDQLKDCDAFMWHHDLLLTKDNLIAKRLLFSLEQSGKIVFPNFYSGWHYDDKIGQKYLLEAIDIPFIPTYIFYDKNDAKLWANTTTYPKVFKLKGGAGSSNVSLITSKKEAFKLIEKAFKTGFNSINKDYFFKENIRKYKLKKITFTQLLKGFIKYFLPKNKNFIKNKEKDYIYFQDFVPNNNSDFRIVIIDKNKGFGIERFNRENDFRASGGGVIKYLDENNIRLDLLELAFEATRKLNMESVAYDFIIDNNNNPIIIEISYAFGSKVSKCPGYWDDKLVWHEGSFSLQQWMIENVINKVEKKHSSL